MRPGVSTLLLACLCASLCVAVWAFPVAGAGKRAASETITVSNTNTTPVQSQTALEADHNYRLVASGTVSDWCPTSAAKKEDCSFGSPLEIGMGVDALYCYATWRCPKPELWRQLRVNGQGLDEIAGEAGKIAYGAGHTYTVEVTGVSGKLSFAPGDGSASDNSGAWTVTITDLGPAGKCKIVHFAASGAEPCLESFKFNAGARHPPHVLAPTGRRVTAKGGWWVHAAELFAGPYLSYFENETQQTPTKTHGATVGFKVTGTELRTSGLAKVLKLDVLTTTEPLQNKNLVTDIYLRCRAGSRGSITLVDDDRLLPGGEESREQTRDKVIVSLPRCPYFDHVYSNGDSFLHEPYVGGATSSGTGGQFAYVVIKTTG